MNFSILVFKVFECIHNDSQSIDFNSFENLTAASLNSFACRFSTSHMNES